MSFAAKLLGKPSHEAIVKLLDYEIKLLEAIKQTTVSRMKCERSYSHSLSQLILQYAKVDIPSYKSVIYNAWKAILRDITQTSQTSKKRSDDLQKISDRIANLIKEKILVKRNYSKERDRIDEDLLETIHSRLNQKQNLYIKTEEEATGAHKNYDQEVAKGKVVAIERAQDKYRKSVMKLHKSHNDYVLQMEDAKLHQKQYRSQTLPQLLDGLQFLEKEFVTELKNILSDYVDSTSPCLEEIVSGHKLTKEMVLAIDPANEHRNFVDAHKTSLENEASLKFIRFSGEGENLPSEEIMLNTMTLQEVENYSQDYKDDIKMVEEQIQNAEMNLQRLDVELSQIPSDPQMTKTYFPKHHEYVQTQLALKEQEGLLARFKHLFTYVAAPLSDLGDKDAPAGIKLPDVDVKSNISPTTPGYDNYSSAFVFNIKKKLTNLISKTNVEDSSKRPSPNVSPNRPLLSPPVQNTPSSSVLPSPPPPSPVHVPSSESTALDPSKPIQQQSWFHGLFPRDESELLLKNDGDFLVRQSRKNDADVVLSTKYNGQFRHFILAPHADGRYYFGGASFASVFEMISFFYKSKVPMSQAHSIYLINPVEKDQWQMNHDEIDIKEELGAGNYGTVYRGVLTTTGASVAIKTCKDTVSSDAKKKFLMEARVLKGYDHPNIVKLIGVATDKQPIYIIMELVTGGDLRNYLQKHTDAFDQRKLVGLCRDACAGMAYLEAKKCIHRDVAARNCLVTDQAVVKISDFGMSRQEDDGVYTMTGANKRIPMRWTSPEAMFYGTFTSASDVWSFGILSWEVFAYGLTPYPGMTNLIVHDKVLSGFRMPPQDNCPTQYYHDVMRLCWLENPLERPRFCDLLPIITNILYSI